MDVVFTIVGSIVIAFVFVDVLWTTLWAGQGAGPLTTRITRWLRAVLRAVIPEGNHQFLALSGPLLIGGTVLSWVLLMWAGWLILFSAEADSVVRTHTQSVPSFAGRVYFTGYTLFTLGNGDLSPQGGRWQIATVLMTASGMFLVTGAVSFFLSVLPAITNKRALASQITSIANRSDLFVLREWDGQGFPMLGVHLNSIVASLGAVTEQHKAYPVLHSYHSAQDQTTNAVAVAVLDDAVTILEYGIPPEYRPSDAVLKSARTAVSNYLDTLVAGVIAPSNVPPPPPSMSMLRNAGVPVINQQKFDDTVRELAERRRKLLGMVQHEAFDWPTDAPSTP